MIDSKTERRRGTRLEDAILEAAWAELIEGGYWTFTMEAVAARAQTSRPVLYRRWPDRGERAIAALKSHFSKNPVHVGDLGSVRDELFSLLRQSADRAAPIAVIFTIQMSEYYRETNTSPADLRSKILGSEQELIHGILSRAVDRGEIDGTKLSKRIASLPTDLARHEIMTTLKPISDSVIREIIDEVFMPLVAPAAPAGTVSKKTRGRP